MKRSVGITLAAAVALALASNAWGANDKKLGLEVVSSPPQYVTGGDARVEVSVPAWTALAR